MPLHSWVTVDGRLILGARAARTFAYGFLSVLLGLYLKELGFAPRQVGLMLTTTLLGGAALTAVFTRIADRFGRRRLVTATTVLMAGAGAAFAFSEWYPLLILAALTGTLGTTSGEVGPFLSLDQAMLPQTVADASRTRMFSLYNLVGALAASAGALFAGAPAVLQQVLGLPVREAFRMMFLLYAGCALIALALSVRLSAGVEAQTAGGSSGGRLHRSRPIVLKLAALFSLDSLAGGFVVQSLIAFYLNLRWNAGPAVLGPVFLWAGLLQAASFLASARVAARIGLVRTMVFTHLPSNVLLMAVPLAPSLGWAIALLLARFALSQMDVPARQSYVVAVVAPEERIAAAGVTNIVRNVAQAATPVLGGVAMQTVGLGVPFLVGGGLKIIYDLLLFAMFRHVRPPEEQGADRVAAPQRH